MRSLNLLRESLARRGRTLLGIGPMSVHCVDAAIELANSLRCPLMLIASRRQVETSALGRGYVNGWSTEEFAAYVREKDHGNYIVLCRDHSGPWQNDPEVRERLGLAEAMSSTKSSLTADMESGIQIIHLDPSVDIHGQVYQDKILDRLFELYEHCVEQAGRLKVELAIEVGAEEQSGQDQDLKGFVRFLAKTAAFCAARKQPQPLFAVAQTGMLVRETRNVGSFDVPFRQNSNIPAEIQVPKVVEVCEGFGVHLKAHNADYLSNEALSWFPKLGIHAANIAPEFGVGETRHILRLCQELGLKQLEERFLELAYASHKWEKWMLSESTATEREKAIIAGHYVFGTEAFQECVAELRSACAKRGIDLDQSIKDALKIMMMRILASFRIYEGV